MVYFYDYYCNYNKRFDLMCAQAAYTLRLVTYKCYDKPYAEEAGAFSTQAQQARSKGIENELRNLMWPLNAILLNW